MSQQEFVQQMVNALMTGSIYALLALGLGLIFSVLRLINFAQGEVVVLGGYAMAYTSRAGWPFWAVCLSALVTSTVTALTLERLAFRPLRGASPETGLVTSFAIAFLIQSVLSLTATARAESIVTPAWANGSLHLGGYDVPTIAVAAIVLTPLLLIGLQWVLHHTRLGISVRAAADDTAALGLTGRRVNATIVWTFVASGLLSGFAAIVLFTRAGSVNPLSGVDIGLTAFVAVVIGGASSLPGAVAAGYGVGIASAMLHAFLPEDMLPFDDALLFLAVLFLLVIRPDGLGGLGLRSLRRKARQS